MTVAVARNVAPRSVVPRSAIVPTFFGDAQRQLFGIHHEPAADAPLGARRAGVVLCPPGPHEGRQAHWALRTLAVRLAEAGLAVLRFDYYATGDSAGASDAGTIAQWTEDVRTAARELADHAGVRRVSLVGLRLGASLAARACGAGLAVHDLVLWDPVTSGPAYLAELGRAHLWQQRESYYPEDPRRAPDELVGLPMPPALRTELAAFDLGVGPLGAPTHVSLVGTNDDPGDELLVARYEATGVRVTRQTVGDPSLRRGEDWQQDVLRPPAALAAIAAQLVQIAPRLR